MAAAKTLMMIQDAFIDNVPAENGPIIKALADKIRQDPGLLDAITPADLDELTMYNYHTIRQAAEMAIGKAKS